jgi:hypothetical protein
LSGKRVQACRITCSAMLCSTWKLELVAMCKAGCDTARQQRCTRQVEAGLDTRLGKGGAWYYRILRLRSTHQASHPPTSRLYHAIHSTYLLRPQRCTPAVHAR